MKEANINKVIKQFIKSANAFDVTTVLTLFAGNAVIDDVSVGEKFKYTEGVRNYLDKFFVGYNTVTKLESVEVLDECNANAQVDFTGDFGHETGVLNFTLDNNGLIKTIHAHLN